MTSAPAHRMPEPEEAHGHTEPVPHHAVKYYWIFMILVVLTVVTVAIAFTRFENEMVNVLLALLVASVKATFVARFFMHLKYEGKLIKTIFVAPLCLCVLLIFALIPDVGRGRKTLLNDGVHMFEGAFGSSGEHGTGGEHADPHENVSPGKAPAMEKHG